MLFAAISSIGLSDTLSLLTILIAIYVSQYYYRYFTRPNPLPGPFPFPLVGNSLQTGHKFNDWMVLMHKKYGDMFELNLASKRVIVICRPDLIDNMHIPSTRSKYPVRFEMTDGFVEYGVDGIGIGNNNHFPSWRFNRQFFSQAMMTPSFNKQTIEWTNELWEEMESYWNDLGGEIDLIKWMRRFTNEMIFRIATGVKNENISSYYNLVLENRKNPSSKQSDEGGKFVDSIDCFIKGFIYIISFSNFVRNYVPFIRGQWKSILGNRDYLFDKLYKVIKERRIEIENTPLDQPLRHDMLTSFLTANTSRDINNVKNVDAEYLRPMTDREIFGNVLDAMAGGTDTTANLFSFIVYYLGHHSDVKQRVRQELDTILGKDLTKPVTLSELDKLHYCDAVIKEVYRHYPIAFMIGRVNYEVDNIGGYNWPEGTNFQMLYSAIMMHKDYWTEPEKFDPDRFYKVDESDKYLLEKKKAKNVLPMFGGGIRMCPGRKLAIVELKCLMASVYRKYDLEMADINAPLNYKSDIINACEELIVKVKPRKF